MKEFILLFWKKFKHHLVHQLLLSNIIGFIIGGINVLENNSKNAYQIFIISFILANSIGLITYSMFIIAGFFWNKKKKIQVILISIVITVFSTTLGLEVGSFIINTFIYHDFILVDPGSRNIMYIALYFVTLFIAGMLMFYSILENRLKRKEAEYERLQKLHVQTKLAMLQSKINPHFLFNTLNTLLSLIYTSPKDAEKCILNLSEIYRRTFQLNEKEYITIDEELQLIKKYLEIEKIRMGDKLNFTIDIQDELKKEKIPAFLIEPIVENAVVHGIAKSKKGGDIAVKIKKMNENICILVENTGASFKDTSRLGFGLYSISERLKLIYGDRAKLFIDNFSEHITIIKLELPYEK